MPLIRLISHGKKNQDMVDKMIFIEGLPKEMLYKKDPAGAEILRDPWEKDVESNLTPDIKEKFGVGIRLDVQTGPGEKMWNDVERLLNRETPRHESVPEPVVVGDRLNWYLNAEDIPEVRLVGEQKEEPKQIESVKQTTSESFKCEACGKVFYKKRALSMHSMKSHPKVAA